MQYYPHRSLSQRIIKSTQCYHTSPTNSAALRGKYHAWEQSNLEKAILAKQGGLSYRRAAAMYAIPTTTLYDHMCGNVELGAKPGPKRYLTGDEEEELAWFLLELAKIGYPRTKNQTLALVQQMVDSKGIQKTVSNGWWERFLRRHSELSLRAAVPLSLARAMATDGDVFQKYFDILEDCLIQNSIFDKPGEIFNCDETGLPLNPDCGKVLTNKGSKNRSYVTGGDKSQVTVLACTSAAGYAILPFVIFDRQTLNQAMTRGEVPGTLYGLSRNGWINSDLFYHWFTNHFLQYAPPTCPLLLLLDGHSSHYSPSTIKLAAENQIVVFVLPPNTTHIAQPLDRGCFSPLKAAWRKYCHMFRSKNPGRVVTRYEFCQIFSRAWFEAMTGNNIVSSFRATGIYPFNSHAFDELITKEPKKPLAEKGNLMYIPLYTPSKHTCRPHVTSMPKTTILTEHSLSDSEIISSPFETSVLGQRSFDDSCVVAPVPFRRATSLCKFLHLPPPPSQIKTKHGKSSGKVLTSQQNLHLLTEKEKMKQDALKKKEERKKMMEERRLQRQPQKRCMLFCTMLHFPEFVSRLCTVIFSSLVCV